MPNHLIQPHGGALLDLLVPPEQAVQLKAASRDWPSWDLTPVQLCDLELLQNGGLSPLDGFMRRPDYESVCETMKLTGGTLWPMPVVLDLPEATAKLVGAGATLGLRDPEGVLLGALHVEEVWKSDPRAEAELVYGTTSTKHPGVTLLLERRQPYLVGGRLEGLGLPTHYDSRALRQTPAELRAEFARLGWRRVLAFGTREPMYRCQHELSLRAAKQVEASLLIHPPVGASQPGDVDHYTRIRCYQAVLSRYPRHTVKLAVLPLASRLAGPREVLWQAIVHQNYGCTHVIVEPRPGVDGEPFHEPLASQELYRAHQEDLEVRMVPSQDLVYAEDLASFLPETEVPGGAKVLKISEQELRRRLAEGREIPEWFSFPEVTRELRRRHPPRDRQGLTIFFTGLSGAGKSTIANVLRVKFLELAGRPVTLLDGDIVRKNLSSELGFSKEHRDLNIKRIGFVASEITKNGGIAICAPIAPYDAVRKEVRAMIEPEGGFVLVHAAASLEVCEQRDRKGLYAKARAGLIKEFTGISDPYEPPDDADVVLGSDLTPEEAAQEIFLHLEAMGFIGPSDSASPLRP